MFYVLWDVLWKLIKLVNFWTALRKKQTCVTDYRMIVPFDFMSQKLEDILEVDFMTNIHILP